MCWKFYDTLPLTFMCLVDTPAASMPSAHCDIRDTFFDINQSKEHVWGAISSNWRLDLPNLSGGWILLAKGKLLTHVDFNNFELKTFREMCFLFALKTFWETLLASVFMAFFCFVLLLVKHTMWSMIKCHCSTLPYCLKLKRLLSSEYKLDWLINW